jgi:hypothetical protein
MRLAPQGRALIWESNTHFRFRYQLLTDTIAKIKKKKKKKKDFIITAKKNVFTNLPSSMRVDQKLVLNKLPIPINKTRFIY